MPLFDGKIVWITGAIKFVAALHPRASVHDLTLYPTVPKVYSPAETGLPS